MKLRKAAWLVVVAVACGCVTRVDQERLEPVANGKAVRLAEAVKVIETRPPFNVKIEWQLLPGTYVEKYRSPHGVVFLSDGPLVQSVSATGHKSTRQGGFIVSPAKPGTGTLFTVVNINAQGFLIPKLVGYGGDLTMVTDFPLSQIKGVNW